MRDLRVSLLSVATFAALGLSIPAQVGVGVLDSKDFQPRNDAGFMSIKRSFNATALTVFPGISCNGEQKACALTSAIWHKGRYWVLGREGWCCATSAATQQLTSIHEWTSAGVYIKTTTVPIPVDPEDELGQANPDSPFDTAPEVRDMSTDEFRYDSGSGTWQSTSGQAVFIGSEEGIHVVRVDGAGIWHLWNQINTANGVKMQGIDFENPIRGAGLAALRANGTPELPRLDPADGVTPLYNAVGAANGEGEGYMGVGFDANGNGGDGSFWVGADDGFGSDGLTFLGDPRSLNDPTDLTTQRTQDGVANTAVNVKSIYEIDLQGNILTELHNGTLVTDVNDPLYTHWDPTGNGDAIQDPGEKDANPANDGFLADGGEWTAGGIEVDPFTGNLWIQDTVGTELIAEVDTTTGDLTGFTQGTFAANPGRTGGITLIHNGDPGSSASFMDLVNFTNVAGDDFFSVHRGHLYPGFNGLSEPRLHTTVNPKVGPPTSVPIRRDYALAYQNDQNIDLLIEETQQGSLAPALRPGFNAFPAIMMMDINAATDTDATTDFSPFGFPGVLPELRVHSFLSAPDPDNTGIPNPPGVVPYFIQFQMPTNVTTLFPIPAVVPTGQKIRMQAIYFDPRSQYSALGAMVTNEAWMAGVGQNQIMIELVGDNSFSINIDGFVRVHYLGGAAIDTVQLNFPGTSSNLDLVDAWWDMDDGPLNGQFGVGRGWDPVAMTLLDLPGCDSTFRQDSDITTGLIYATEYNYPVEMSGSQGPVPNPVPQYVPGSYAFTGFGSPACDYYTDELGYEFRSGLTGTPDQVGVTKFEDDLDDVIFQFSDFDDPGDVLMWDCDTDATVPNSAEGHVGLNVVVVFAGGAQVESGDMLLDPNGGRVFIGW